MGALISIALFLSFGIVASAGLRNPAPGTSDPGFWWRVVFGTTFAATALGALIASAAINLARLAGAAEETRRALGLSHAGNTRRPSAAIPTRTIWRWFDWQEGLRDIVWVSALCAAAYSIVIAAGGVLSLFPPIDAASDWLSRRGPILFALVFTVVLALARRRTPFAGAALLPTAAEWRPWQRTAGSALYGVLAALLYPVIQPRMESLAHHSPEPLWMLLPLGAFLALSTAHAAADYLTHAPSATPFPDRVKPEPLSLLMIRAGSDPGVLHPQGELVERFPFGDFLITFAVTEDQDPDGDPIGPGAPSEEAQELESAGPTPPPVLRFGISNRLREIVEGYWLLTTPERLESRLDGWERGDEGLPAPPKFNGVCMAVETASLLGSSAPDSWGGAYFPEPPVCGVLKDAASAFFRFARTKGWVSQSTPLAITLAGAETLDPESRDACRRLLDPIARCWVRLAEDIGQPAPPVYLFLPGELGPLSSFAAPERSLPVLLWLILTLFRVHRKPADRLRNLTLGRTIEADILAMNEMLRVVEAAG